MIVAALAAGAVKGEVASVGDAYRGLRSVLARVFGGSPSAEVVLAEHEADPDAWAAPLSKLLRDNGIDKDPQIVAAANRLLELADPRGSREGKYAVG